MASGQWVHGGELSPSVFFIDFRLIIVGNVSSLKGKLIRPKPIQAATEGHPELLHSALR